MSRDSILEWLQRQPFVPFQVRLSNGDAFVVRHPECAALTKNNLIIVNPDSDRTATCALIHIADIIPAESNSSSTLV